jgi:nuclear pore complex protein Nup155
VQRFVLVGTAGVLEVERRRPVDLLAGLLLEGSPAKLQQFFGSYGSAEAAAMCYTLATWDVTSMPAVSNTVTFHCFAGPPRTSHVVPFVMCGSCCWSYRHSNAVHV